MLTIGDQFPNYNLKAVKAGPYPETPDQAFEEISNQTYNDKWQVIFFYPKDFTFVCPTEIVEFANLNNEFKERNTALMTVSTDSEFAHLAWKRDHKDLATLQIPMLSDLGGSLSQQLGILNKNEAIANRATFIVDPSQTIRYVSVNDLNVGRNPNEILRVLDALQTDEMCPCNWKPGDAVL